MKGGIAMQLVIAEKPSVGRSVASVIGATEKKDGYLEGNGYIVTWCIGHLVQLASPDKYDSKYGTKISEWSFSTLPILPEHWKFVVSSTTKQQFQVIQELMQDSLVDEIICATDAGREGECIFRYVYEKIGCTKPCKRLWISSMEDKAIREGFSNLRPDSDYDNLYAAGLCRAKADWLVGLNSTRLFTCRYGTLLSIGRVQTPTLAMIVQRDYDVKHFVKQKFFTVELDCGTFVASSERIDEEESAKNIAESCSGKTATISEIKKEIKTVNPPKLYDLTTLQREANRQYGYTAQQALDYTQSLYEQKLVTYPRTDSQYLTEDMEQTAADLIQTICNTISCCQGLSIPEPNVKRCINNSKVSDHHAIIPTAEIAHKKLADLPDGERNILNLIAAKLILATADPHRYEATKISVICENHNFSATGKAILNDGWKAFEITIKEMLKSSEDTVKSGDEKTLPPLEKGQVFENVTSSVIEHYTSPPKPYTEDTLLKAMETAGNHNYDENADVEKKGLGPPATRAAILETLVKRAYIERKKKQIFPTAKGISLIAVVPDEVKSAQLTADWETQLQEIERGQCNPDDFMHEIVSFVSDISGKYNKKAENAAFQAQRTVIGKCPKCGKNVVEWKKSFSCENDKEKCGFIIWKSICNKIISATQTKKLLEKGKTDLIKGFKSKAGNEFDAYLILKDDKTTGFEFPPRKK